MSWNALAPLPGCYSLADTMARVRPMRRRAVIILLGAAAAAGPPAPRPAEEASPVMARGLVGSLNRPAGNVTGVASLRVEVTPKRLEFLQELFPTASSFAVLINPTSPSAVSQLRNLQAAARTLGAQLHILHAS